MDDGQSYILPSQLQNTACYLVESGARSLPDFIENRASILCYNDSGFQQGKERA